jgi:hypothetical protein
MSCVIYIEFRFKYITLLTDCSKMAGSSSRLLLVAAIFPALYLSWYPLLNQFGGRVSDAKLHVEHIGHPPLNNDKCWTFPGILTVA